MENIKSTTINFNLSNRRKGALLYGYSPYVRSVRPKHPGHLNTQAVCITAFRTRGFTLCAAKAAIPIM